MRDLYHGSTEDIMEIDFRKGKGYKDFGKGFYATAVKKHADSIALRNKKALQAREERLRKRIPGYKAKTFTAYRYNLDFKNYDIRSASGQGFRFVCRVSRICLGYATEGRTGKSEGVDGNLRLLSANFHYSLNRALTKFGYYV